MSVSSDKPRRRRMSAEQRREAIIEAAVSEFARGGLHGTPVERVAKRVKVAQPYVFALFASKQELFIAAVERGFERVSKTFEAAAAAYEAGDHRDDCKDVLQAMGSAYVSLLSRDRDCLMLQHQSYAACGEVRVREVVRHRYALLVTLVRELSRADAERLDAFFSKGMALNVAAAMGVSGLAVDTPWVGEEVGSRDEQGGLQSGRRRPQGAGGRGVDGRDGQTLKRRERHT